MELRNRWVHFKVSDVYFPEPEKVLNDLYGQNLLQGKVVDISISTSPEGSFAVVAVEGLENAVVVPIDRILGVL